MNSKRTYRNMVKNIHAPEELKQDLFLRAEQQSASVQSSKIQWKQTSGKKQTVRRMTRRTWQGIAAAACICALLAGTAGYHHSIASETKTSGSAGGGGTVSHTVQTQNRFYLASPDQETHSAENHSSVTSDSSGQEQLPAEETVGGQERESEGSTEAGHGQPLALSPANSIGGTQYFTGCEFLLQGDNIQSVSMSMDRGGLYQVETEQMSSADAKTKLYTLPPYDPKQKDYQMEDTGSGNGEETADFLTKTYVGQTITLNADGQTGERFGFYLPDEALSSGGDGQDLQQSFHNALDYLNGAVLSVRVTYSDQTTESCSYQLQTGKIRYSFEGGQGHIVPEFLPEDSQEDQPYIYGILLSACTGQ